jgi:hypothetical protein
MPRIYKKSENAKTEKITVPMSPDLLAKLRAYALELGVSPTPAARILIEQGLRKQEEVKCL